MPRLILAFAILVLMQLQGCSDSAPDSSTLDDDQVFSGSTQIQFIHLNDLHANLIAHWEAVRQPGSDQVLMQKRGGLARIAGKIDQLRQQFPEQTVLMNIGDTFHGGAEAMFSNGNAIVAPVNALAIDVGVPGNWDYAYGPLVSNMRFGNLYDAQVLRPDYPNLAANAKYKIPDQITQPFAQNMVQQVFNYQAGDDFLPPSLMLKRQGLNLGFIGLTSDIVPRMHPLMAFNIEFTQGRAAYLQLLQQQAEVLKQQGADMVVVMSELGIHKDWELAKALPTGLVQIFFSAHTHEATYEPLITTSGTYVVEAGNDTTLGQMLVDFDDNRQISGYHWQLYPITEAQSENVTVASLVEQARAAYVQDNPNLSIATVTLPNMPPALTSLLPQTFSQTLDIGLDNEIGQVSLPLTRRNALENEFNDLYTDWLRQATGADVAISPGFRFDSAVIPDQHDHSGEAANYYWQVENNAVLNGVVTAADVYRFFPAPYQLAQGEISAAGLKNVIESNLTAVFSSDIFQQNGGWLDGYSGIKLQIDLAAADGNQILSMTRSDDSVILDSDLLQVAGCARPMDMNATTTLCSYSGFSNVLNLENPDKAGQNWAAADLMIKAVSEDWISLYGLKERHDISDTSGTAQWPDSAFYQPLEGVSP